jgi:hypothetical protein
MDMSTDNKIHGNAPGGGRELPYDFGCPWALDFVAVKFKMQKLLTSG